MPTNLTIQKKWTIFLSRHMPDKVNFINIDRIFHLKETEYTSSSTHKILSKRDHMLVHKIITNILKNTGKKKKNMENFSYCNGMRSVVRKLENSYK